MLKAKTPAVVSLDNYNPDQLRAMREAATLKEEQERADAFSNALERSLSLWTWNALTSKWEKCNAS